MVKKQPPSECASHRARLAQGVAQLAQYFGLCASLRQSLGVPSRRVTPKRTGAGNWRKMTDCAATGARLAQYAGELGTK